MRSTQIGKFRVLAKLGQGGMAHVLLTVLEGPAGVDKLLVVKVLREELAEDPEFLSMFLEEARITARLNHSNVVQSYEVGEDAGAHFIAMEYLEGQPLSALIRAVGRQNMSLHLYVRVLSEVLLGLDHAHSLRDYDGRSLEVVHRDVNPQNVFITYDGQVKLLDFGIAKAKGAALRTREGMLKGKLAYLSPEQARCEDVDLRTDIFAVGIMLWEAIVGRRLGTNDDEGGALARRISGKDPKVREARPDAPIDLAAICDRAMAPDPAERYESARAFHEALERWLDTQFEPPSKKELAAIMTRTFEKERASIRETIETQLRKVTTSRASRASDPIQIDLVPPSLRATSESLPLVQAGMYSASPPSQMTALSQSVDERPRSSKTTPLVAVGVLVAAVTVGGGLLLANRGSDAVTSGTSQPQGGAVLAAGSVVAAATATSTAQDDPSMITITIEYPEDARAKLDGAAVEGNPFTAKVKRDGGIHRIEVERAGFRTERRTVVFDRDQTVSIALTPVSYPGQPARPILPPTGGRKDPPATPTQRSTASVEIDESNPYKKRAP